MEQKQYSAAELERTLKVQEVIAKAMARKLTCGKLPRSWVEQTGQVSE